MTDTELDAIPRTGFEVRVDHDELGHIIDETTIGVYVDGEEVGRYCVVEAPEDEARDLERMIRLCAKAECGALIAEVERLTETHARDTRQIHGLLAEVERLRAAEAITQAEQAEEDVSNE